MAWLTGWNYRKAITITNAGSALTNYQVSVTVDTASLVTASPSKMRSDCGDIRFTDTDGSTSLPYWIESGVNSSSTKIWIKIPSVPASETIYIYYGNSSATYNNSTGGTDTFDFYDDFNDNDISDWTQMPSTGYGGAAIDVIGGAAHGGGTSTSRGIMKTYTVGQSVVWETSLQRTGQMNDGRYGKSMAMLTFNGAGGYWPYEGYMVQLDTQNDSNSPIPNAINLIRVNNAGVTTNIIGTANGWAPDANYHTIKVTRNASNLFELFVDGTSKGTATDSTYSGLLYVGFWFISGGGSSQKDGYMDYFRIRKYASPEPTFSISGTEDLGVTATAMTITPSETPCRTGICTVTVNVTWQNVGSSSITFRPKILIDGVTYVQAASDMTLGSYLATDSSSITTSTLSAGIHSICPYPN